MILPYFYTSVHVKRIQKAVHLFVIELQNIFCYTIPSLTVERLKNRCIPCVYWAAAIFLVVTEYSNLFFSFAFFLDGFHFTFGYELIIRLETTGIMKIVCDSLSFV